MYADWSPPESRLMRTPVSQRPPTHAPMQTRPQPPQCGRLVMTSTHSLPHAVRPDMQLMPQTPPAHVAEPPDGAGHGVQRVPHVAGSVAETQLPPQSW